MPRPKKQVEAVAPESARKRTLRTKTPKKEAKESESIAEEEIVDIEKLVEQCSVIFNNAVRDDANEDENAEEEDEEEEEKEIVANKKKQLIPKLSLNSGLENMSYFDLQPQNSIVQLKKEDRKILKATKTESLSEINDRLLPSSDVNKKPKEVNAGDKWFGMKSPELTDDIKRDLQILANRGAIDQKRFYKTDKMKKNKKVATPTFFEMGTVIEGMGEFFTSRLTNKERKATFTAELLGDKTFQKFAKRKFNEVQERTQSGGKTSFKRRKNERMKPWQKS